MKKQNEYFYFFLFTICAIILLKPKIGFSQNLVVCQFQSKDSWGGCAVQPQVLSQKSIYLNKAIIEYNFECSPGKGRGLQIGLAIGGQFFPVILGQRGTIVAEGEGAVEFVDRDPKAFFEEEFSPGCSLFLTSKSLIQLPILPVISEKIAKIKSEIDTLQIAQDAIASLTATISPSLKLLLTTQQTLAQMLSFLEGQQADLQNLIEIEAIPAEKTATQLRLAELDANIQTIQTNLAEIDICVKDSDTCQAKNQNLLTALQVPQNALSVELAAVKDFLTSELTRLTAIEPLICKEIEKLLKEIES